MLSFFLCQKTIIKIIVYTHLYSDYLYSIQKNLFTLSLNYVEEKCAIA